jgi:hypothetical protein
VCIFSAAQAGKIVVAEETQLAIHVTHGLMNKKLNQSIALQDKH